MAGERQFSTCVRRVRVFERRRARFGRSNGSDRASRDVKVDVSVCQLACQDISIDVPYATPMTDESIALTYEQANRRTLYG